MADQARHSGEPASPLDPRLVAAPYPPSGKQQGIEALLDDLLDPAQAALVSLEQEGPSTLAPFAWEEFSCSERGANSLESLPKSTNDLELRIQLGTTELAREEVAKFRSGALVPLDQKVSDPAEIFVEGKLVARGELLVLNGKLCVRVTELVTDQL